MSDPFLSLAQRFFHIEQWHSAKPVGNGNINDTYRIDFEQNGQSQTYLLQRLNHLVFKQPDAVMANWQAVAAHLQQQHFPYAIPTPVPTHEGNLLQMDADGNYWRVFPFFQNTFSPETAATPAVAYEAAKAYGAFLKALGDFPAAQLAETIPGFHDTQQRWRVFLDVYARDPKKRNEKAAHEIEQMLEAQYIIREIHRLKKSGALPVRATHNDTKAGNVLLDSTTEKAVAVIDWDTLMPGTALSDFGDMMRSFAPDRHESHQDTNGLRLRMDVIAAMCKGFLAETGDFLTKTERENLFLGGQWIIAEQALRFLSDYLEGDVYYKIAYPAHNLIRARNQLALLQKMTEAEKEIKAFLE